MKQTNRLLLDFALVLFKNSLPKTRLIIYLTCFLNSASETDSAFYSDGADSDEMDCSDQPAMVGCF